MGARRLPAMGFAPVMGGGGGKREPAARSARSSPAARSASRSSRATRPSVSGTVTHIDHDRVYAFGHPFYNLGPTQFPLKKAWVHAVFPSLQVSWKIASTLDAVGTLDQDRTTAVAGRIGPLPRMIPVEVRLRYAARERARLPLPHGRGRAVHARSLAYASLLSVLQSQRARVRRRDASARGAAHARRRTRGALRRRVRERAAGGAGGRRGGRARSRYLIAERLREGRGRARRRSRRRRREPRGATLERAWVDAPLPLRPGSVRARAASSCAR